MVNQNLCLESVYAYAIQHEVVSIKQVANFFNANTAHIVDKLIELQSMGLSLQINSDHVILKNPVSLIDSKYIQSKLNMPVEFVFSTKSTNTLAKNSKQDAVFICEHQSLGRGQRDKKWLTSLGHSVAFSLTHSFDTSIANLSGLNIAMGVAVVKSINNFSKQKASLKWPNDIIGRDGKIAGILIEAQGDKSTSKVCIGIGINWNISSELINTIDQLCTNASIDSINRSQFIVSLVNEINEMIAEFKVNKLKNIINQWHKYDRLKNQKIIVNRVNESFHATYIGVDTKGLLVVEANKVRQTLSSASIKFAPLK